MGKWKWGMEMGNIEAKFADHHLSKTLAGLHRKYSIPAVQVVQNIKRERVEGGVEIRNARSLLEGL